MNARRLIAASAFALLSGCATEGTVGVGVGYESWYYDPWYDWYGGGVACCVDYPDGVGPPRPEHPIALPPGSEPRPSHPIAKVPDAQPKASQQTAPRSAPAPRPAAMPRGGGGGMRGGGGRR